ASGPRRDVAGVPLRRPGAGPLLLRPDRDDPVWRDAQVQRGRVLVRGQLRRAGPGHDAAGAVGGAALVADRADAPPRRGLALVCLGPGVFRQRPPGGAVMLPVSTAVPDERGA